MDNNDLQEMWISAIEAGMFCPDCALPMLMIPSDDNQNVGTYQCPYCTWLEDEHGYVFQKQIYELKRDTQIVLLQLADNAERRLNMLDPGNAGMWDALTKDARNFVKDRLE